MLHPQGWDTAVFDEFIWPADADDGSRDAGVPEVFPHGAAEAVVHILIVIPQVQSNASGIVLCEYALGDANTPIMQKWPVLIDANVFVASALIEDKFHDVAAEFLLEARLAGETVYEPVLLLAEVAGAISRVRQDHAAGDVAILRIEHFPRSRLRIADGPFARRAARLAARHGLAGADSHYLTLAVECSSTLVTLDGELHEHGSHAARVVTPEEWLLSRITAWLIGGAQRLGLRQPAGVGR